VVRRGCGDSVVSGTGGVSVPPFSIVPSSMTFEEQQGLSLSTWVVHLRRPWISCMTYVTGPGCVSIRNGPSYCERHFV